MSTTTPVIALDHPAALDVARVGRKAAALATARATGLPVAPGVVLTTEWATDDHATAAQVWRITSHDGTRPLVVRPSATGPDRCGTPGGGAVEAVTVVDDVDALLAAVAAVRADDDAAPVLVQPHLAGSWRGVLFADDQASGWRATPIVVARRAGGATEWIAELDHQGRVRSVLSADASAGPPLDVLTHVARLAQRVADSFDGPQDIEWLVDGSGRVQLLRIRPVARLRPTPATGTARPVGAMSRADRSRRRRTARRVDALVSGRSVDDSAA
jgi:hypothetical protein